MIISSNYKFVFVHIPKTAGLSVTDAMGKYGRPKGRNIWRSLSRRLPLREGPEKAHFRVHEPASKIVEKLGRPIFDSFLSFSVIRNPFDHAVSHYEYMKQFRISSVAQKVGKMSFAEYLEYRILPPSGRDTVFARLPDQTYFLTDKSDQIVVDRLLRFDNIQKELGDLAEELKLPDFAMRHLNKTQSKSSKRPFQDYYDTATEAAVREIYSRDFDSLGFDTKIPPLVPHEKSTE